MSKRNFILLIIILVIVLAVIFGFLYFRNTPTPGDDGTGTNFGSPFNPFGTNPNTPPNNTTTPPTDISGNEPDTTPAVTQKLIKVSSVPVAGFSVYQKERLKEVNPTPTLPLSGEGEVTVPPAKGGSGGQKKTPPKPLPPPTEFAPALRYVDRITGNIFQTFADKIEERRFSTTVIPKIYEAFFGTNAESVIMRYLKADGKTIATFYGILPKEVLGADTTEDNQVKGSFLPEDIKDASLSADAGGMFYLFDSGENAIGTTINLATNKRTQVFDSPFTEWLSQWPTSKMITLTTKPASNVPGYMYAFDPTATNKNIAQVLGNINGLTALTSPSGKLVLYGDSNLSLSVYHTDTKTSDLLGVRTLPEKCVWSKTNYAIYCAVPRSISGVLYPDSWYQGEASFSDQIWKIDIASGNATILADPINALVGEDVDGIKLALDAGENYLLFVNKKDSFLWELNLK